MSGKSIFTRVMFPVRNLLRARHGMVSANFRAHVKASKEVEATHELANGQVKVIMELLDCPYHRAYSIVSQHRVLMDLDTQRLEKAVEMCGRFGIQKRDILDKPEVLAILPVTIEQHAMLLQEFGFEYIDPHFLVQYMPLMKKRISLLKAYGYIPTGVDVSQCMLSHLEPEVPPITAKLPADSDTNLLEVNAAVVRHYLAWRLAATPEQLAAVFKTYLRIKHKSLRLIRRTLDLLEGEIGFTKDKIMRHGYLIHSHPDNTRRSLDEVGELGGMPVREVYHKYPKVVMTSADTLLRTAEHLQEFRIPDEAVRRCPEIFTLSSASVHRRLSYLRTVPELSVLTEHPRVLRLVHYQRKAKTRLEYLHELRFKCASLHILSATDATFERYARDGADKTKGTYVVQYLSQVLGHDEKPVRAALSRQPFWCHVPLVAVKETLDFLLQSGFSLEQIYSSIHVLLYAKERVESELLRLPERPELSPRNLTPLCRGWKYPEHATQSYSGAAVEAFSSSSSDEESGDWSSPPSPLPSPNPAPSIDHRLDFVVYFVERDHHFTGDGIWPQQEAAAAGGGDPAAAVPPPPPTRDLQSPLTA